MVSGCRRARAGGPVTGHQDPGRRCQRARRPGAQPTRPGPRTPRWGPSRGRPPASGRRHEMRRSRVRITSMVGGAAVGLVAALTIASVATAQDDTELLSASDASEHLTVTVAVTGNCTATITYTNAVPAGL